MTRKIIHVDMDAFFASVEQRDNPALRGRPVVVGGAPNKRGVVAAASYEARAYGIHSAMACARAQRLCADVVFVAPRFDIYRAVSRQIRAIFHNYTWLVEPLSLDEAYLDVTEVRQLQGSATRIATQIKQRVHEHTGLTASAGVSYNKLLAKLASDMDKPDGLTIIPPDHAPAVLADLAVKHLPGVGPATQAKMRKLKIHSCADLLARSPRELAQAFGSAGPRFARMAAGLDERPVNPHRAPKSIGAETTFFTDITSVPELLAALAPLTATVSERLRKRHLAGTTVTLKVKYANFELVTRSRSLDHAVDNAHALQTVLPQLLARTEAGRRAVRLVGVTVSSLQTPQQGGVQTSLFEPRGVSGA